MAVSNPAVKSRYSVSEVAGLKTRDVDVLMNMLVKECAAKIVQWNEGSVEDTFKMREGQEGSVVVRVDMAELESGKELRAEGLEDRGMLLHIRKSPNAFGNIKIFGLLQK
jgi:hypothetical protein